MPLPAPLRFYPYSRLTFASQERDLEIGTAGLASVETLGDSKGSVDLTEDGLETVTLDVEDSKDGEKVELASKEESDGKRTTDWRIVWANCVQRCRNLTMVEKAIGKRGTGRKGSAVISAGPIPNRSPTKIFFPFQRF